MSQITLKSASGKDAGKVDLDDATFGIDPNVSVMHQVVTAQLAARRSGTQSTKTRSEVRGGGAKPYRQKGTGNARQGSIRSPQFVGGGVALGPKPRSYSQKTPKKMVALALRSALSDRANDGKVVVVDEWGFASPSTKAAKAALADLDLDGKVLVVVDRDDANTALSFRNLQEVQLIETAELNAYDVLCNDYVVFTQTTLPAAASAPTKPKQAAEPATPKPATSAGPDHGDGEFESGEYAGSVVADADGNGPDTHLIKGNADSMLYHVPGSSHYKRTKAEVWFDSEESAEAAGFQKPASQRDSADEAAADADADVDDDNESES